MERWQKERETDVDAYEEARQPKTRRRLILCSRGHAWFRASFRGSGFGSCEHARKNLIDVSQLPLQIESPLDLLTGHTAGNIWVRKHQLAKIQSFLPCAHGVSLHHAIGVFARNTVLH